MNESTVIEAKVLSPMWDSLPHYVYICRHVSGAVLYVGASLNVMARLAKREGRLVLTTCERCGAKATDAHHDDYTKPLDIMQLCRSCHIKRHLELGWGRSGRPNPVPFGNRCDSCGKPKATKAFCLPCAIRRRERQRARLGITRRIDGITYKLEAAAVCGAMNPL